MKYPRCIFCKRRATKWDGGICSVSIDKNNKQVAAPPIFLCNEHDKYNKYFGLPQTRAAAIEELVILRQTLQDVFSRSIRK